MTARDPGELEVHLSMHSDFPMSQDKPNSIFSILAQFVAMASSTLPFNVHVSTHPCLRAKLSQLRSKAANARETKSLVHEIALILGCETLANSLHITSSGTVSFICTAAPTSSPEMQPRRIQAF